MTIKKTYKINDTVWIYGISRDNNRITKGKIIHSFTLENLGYTEEQYVIEIPSSIEPLLEIRTWHTISQDKSGPVGAFRAEVTAEESDAVDKQLGNLGMTLDVNNTFDDEDDPSPDQIHAALEKSQKDQKHTPLNLKESAPKKRYNRPRKKKV